MSAVNSAGSAAPRATAPQSAVELSASDLLGGSVTFCPNPKMTLWNGHPKVFVNVGQTGRGRCPYCGTEYRLKAGESVHGH
jgi:uncharacterized Zn-finger protein